MATVPLRVSGYVLKGDVLAREMATRGFTVTALAKKAGVAPSTISAAIHGRKIAPSTLRKIAFVLEAEAPVTGAEALLAG